jgi:signal peptidase II
VFAMWKLNKKREIAKLLAAVVACIVFDFFSKMLVYEYFESTAASDEASLCVLPFLNFVLNWNYGISFGMLNDVEQNQMLLSFLASGIILSLLVWYAKAKDASLTLPFGLIIGGAIGNVIDRKLYGAVLDFIDLHALGYHYPTFNIADSVIVIGAVILLYPKKSRNIVNIVNLNGERK